MKITITEFRDMVAEAVRRTVREARKPKEVPSRSEESVVAQRDAQVRGLPGYTHGNVLDMSRPLGKRNMAKRQGAAGIGGWTSEARLRGSEDGMAPDGGPGDQGRPVDVLAKVLQGHGMSPDQAQEICREFQSAVGAEQDVRSEAVRRLVRMVVREEIRVSR